ncbi:uncharacterized protein LOC124885806 [Capsicum annuum]|uniref:uncharacterized protein LOC124885806 n=1 Tax=Capsicum annuum TaxID=4072 RepID=UPI001FB17622|nr:uncharacterized protein LOC124885806 [Capsicum annuum]
MSFNYTTVKSCKKYLRVRYVDPTCRWMARACTIGESGWFHIHKYMGEHTCGIDHVTGKHKNVIVEVIASLILNFFIDNKGPSPKEIERILKAFVIDEPELCVIFDRHVSIANGLARHYSLTHYGVCMRHLGENLRINHHCFDSLYLYYHATKAYTLKEFNDYFNALKERCPSPTACLEHEVGFEKWSRAHFPSNRFNVMTSNIAESLNSMFHDEREYPVAAIFNSIAHRFEEIFRKMYAEVDNSKTTFVPVAEMILRKNMIEGDKLYMNNINGSTDEFTVLGYDHSAKVNILRRLCSCRKYDLVKLLCAHAMAALRLKHRDKYGTSVYNYFLQMYLKESYLLAYLEAICAASLESKWSVVREYLEMQVLLPDFDPKLRRRKVKRIKGVLELSRYKKRNKFSKCKRPGHKRTTCSLNVG